MATLTDRCIFDPPLLLEFDHDPFLVLKLVELGLGRDQGPINSCVLQLQISEEQLQGIESRPLFNLDSEIRSPLSGEAFQPTLPLQLEVSLDPDQLYRLTGFEDPRQVGEYLYSLTPEDALRATENWYGLRVTQSGSAGETGYTTLWAYLPPTLLGEDPIPSQCLSEAMVTFSRVCAQARGEVGSETEEAELIEQAEQVTTQVTQAVDSVLGRFSQELESSLTGLADEIADSITAAFEPLTSVFDDAPKQGSEALLPILIRFFQAERWVFQQVDSTTLLILTHEGENGCWECHAESYEEEYQVLFYSLCPVPVPENLKPEMAEFLCRANAGLTIGNFEMDWEDGQIRFKTSLDVEGDRLSMALLRTLVYTNVLTLDTYLPGLKAVIEDRLRPIEALALVEGD